MKYQELFKNRGMSLIELIVVLSILAVLGSLSVVGLLSFRQTTILKQASREIFTNLESTRNKARNNTLSVSKENNNNVFNSKVDAYAIYFEDNNYALYYCDEAGTAGGGTDEYTCGVESANLKQPTFSNVEISVNEGSPYECKGVLFETVSGNMKLFDDIDSVRTVDEECTLLINFTNTSIRELLRLDAINNQMSYISN